MAGRDAVFGVRRRRYDPVLRLYLSQLIRHSVNVLFRVRLSDANAPFKLFRRGIWTETRDCVPDGTLAPSMFLAIAAKWRGYNILEIDVTHKERDTGEVTLRNFKLLKFCARGLGQMLGLDPPCPLSRLPSVALAKAGASSFLEPARPGWAPPGASRNAATGTGCFAKRPRTPEVLASSVIDSHGFTWDLGGHVLFSHYRYFDDVMDRALGDAWVEHVREAWVWMRDRWIPYPFQNNIWRLPQAELEACVAGLQALQSHDAPAPPATFREWLLRHSAPASATLSVSLQPKGLGLRSVGAERAVDGGARRHGQSASHPREHRAQTRRCELGAELDVSISADTAAPARSGGRASSSCRRSACDFDCSIAAHRPRRPPDRDARLAKRSTMTL